MGTTLCASVSEDNRDPFAHRAADYAVANNSLPNARRAERDRLLDGLPDTSLARVVDLQAASGYVGEGLLERTQGRVSVTSVEPSQQLVSRIPARLGPVHADLHALPFGPGSFDAVACLAGTHHSEGLDDIIAESYRVLAPGGSISIAEVETGSDPANWLNGFVDHWSPDGHAGRFVSPGDLEREMRAAGFIEVAETREDVPWRFSDRTALVSFCRTLFGVGSAPVEEVEAGLESSLGIVESDGGALLPWRLRYATGSKRTSSEG